VSATAAVLALGGTLLVRRGVVDVLLMVLIGGALVGAYLLRRYARTALLYRRMRTASAPVAGTGQSTSPFLPDMTRTAHRCRAIDHHPLAGSPMPAAPSTTTPSPQTPAEGSNMSEAVAGATTVVDRPTCATRSAVLQ